MDNTAYTLLRPTTQRADHIYGVGHWWPALCDSCRGVDVQVVWKEVVRDDSYQFFAAQLILKSRTLRRGKHRLLLWPDVEADGSLETTTPSKMVTQDEMGRLEKVSTSLHIRRNSVLTSC